VAEIIVTLVSHRPSASGDWSSAGAAVTALAANTDGRAMSAESRTRRSPADDRRER